MVALTLCTLCISPRPLSAVTGTPVPTPSRMPLSKAARDSTAPIVGGLPNFKVTDIPAPNYSKLPRDSAGRPIVAKVNGEAILLDEFTTQLRLTAPQPRNADTQQKLAVANVLSTHVLDTMITTRLIEQAARRAGIRVDDSEVTRTIAANNAIMPAGRKMQDLALATGMTVAEMHEQTRLSLLMDKVRDIATSTVVVREEDLPTTAGLSAQEAGSTATLSRDQITSAQLARILTEPQYGQEMRAAHIVLRCLDGATSSAEKQAREKAEAVLGLLRSGLDFPKAALLYSQDGKTAANGGELGWFTRGTNYPAFDEAAFALKPGEISAVVRTPVGFHIIQGGPQQAGRLHTRTQQLNREEAFEKYKADLKAHSEIERYL